ncbi:MAG: glycosyltransferase family 2 protein [Synergistaceae bacterium]|nr:glycosyltransferase family 2 protein [Synergistaceae bacterium]
MINNAATMRTANSEQRTANSHNCGLVSIIIPAYNTAPYIHRAIESSLRQTYTNVEVLVIDDGSTDETLKVTQEYTEQDRRLRVFRQANAGVSSARNRGIRESKGEYLVFLDSDDWLEDDAVETLLDAQTTYPDRLITSRVRFVHSRYVMQSRILKNNLLDYEQAIASFSGVLFGNVNSSCFKIFRRDIVVNNKVTFPEGIFDNEDGLFSFEYLQRTNGVYCLHDVLWNVLEREGSATHSAYNHKVFQDTLNVFTLMENNKNITSAAKVIVGINKAYYLLRVKRRAVMSNVDTSELKSIDKHIKPHTSAILRSNFIPVTRRLEFLVVAYMPALITRNLVLLWKRLKQFVSCNS